MSIAAAAAAAGAFGAGDFLGGLAIRGESWRRVAAIAMGSGVLVLAGTTALFSDVTTDIPVLWCLIAGVSLFVGVSQLYSALAAGMMTSVAPITASVAIAVPALVDAATGTPLSMAVVAGLAAAMLSIFLLSSTGGTAQSGRVPGSALALALGAGAGLALFYIGLDKIEEAGGGMSGLTAVRCVAFLAAVAVALPGQKAKRSRSGMGQAFSAGILDGLANLFLLRAFATGGLAEISAVASLYPAATILLAIAVLRERPSRLQILGILLAIVAITLLNFG